MTDSLRPPAPRPCESCPYRRDVPSGVWAASEYDKLRQYDGDTAVQPVRAFLCHQAQCGSDASRLCAGWVGCHGGHELLAVRIAVITGQLSARGHAATVDYVSPVALFTSGAEAADHGQAEIDSPGPAALRVTAKIQRKRPDVTMG